MSKAKKILITTKTREVLTVRKFEEPPINGFCTICFGKTSLLTLDEAVSVAGSILSLSRGLEAGLVHGRESASGRMYICPESLGNLDM